MISFKGHPQDGGLYTGYDVVRDGQVIGSINVCGIFKKNSDAVLLDEIEREVIRKACKRIYKMPSEYGCLGVGESPTEPFEDFLRKYNLKQDYD